MASSTDILKAYAKLPATTPSNSVGSILSQTAPAASPVMPTVAPTYAAPINIDDQAAYNIAAGIASGQGQASATGDEAALRSMDPLESIAKYGVDSTAANANQLNQAGSMYQADRSQNAGVLRGATDMAVAGVGGFLSTLGTVGEMATGAVSPEAGAYFNELNKGVSTISDALSSDALASHKLAQAARNVNYNRDSSMQQKEDAAKHGDLVAGFMKVGRDAIHAVSDTVSDPNLLAEGAANAIGSLYATGPVAKLIGGGAKLLGLSEDVITKLAAVAATDAKAGNLTTARALNWMAENAPTALSIGTLEAGGAYNGAAGEILGMDPKDLYKTSPDFKRMVDEGQDPEVAKKELARSAGMYAGALAAPIGVIAGAMVAPLEKAPMQRALGKVGSDTLKETAEEAAQGASGQISQNLAVKKYGDKNKDITEGVGEQVGQGGLFGGMSGAGVHAAGTAARTAAGAAKVAKAVAGKTQTTVENIKTNAQEKANKASTGVSTEALSTRADEAVQSIQEAQKAPEAPTETPVESDQQTKVDAAMEAVKSTLKPDFSTMTNESTPASVTEAVSTSKNSVEAMDNLASLIEDPKTEQLDKMHAAHTLMNLIDNVKATYNEHGETIDSLPEDHPARKAMDTTLGLLSDLRDSDPVRNALKTVRAAVNNQEATGFKVTEDNISTPEGQTAAMAVALKAKEDLASVDPEQAKTVIAAAAKGGLQLDDQSIASLKAVSAITEAAKAADQRMVQAVGEKARMPDWKRVGMEVMSEGRKKMTSGADFVQQVISAMGRGDVNQAKASLESLGKFTESQGNKVDALNRSVTSGQAEKYGTYSVADRVPITSAEGVRLDPSNGASVTFSNKVANEAQYLADLHNHLVQAYPELGVKERTVPSLIDTRPSTKATKPVAEAKQAKPAKAEATVTEKKIEPKQEKKPEPVKQEPKVEPKKEEVKKPTFREQAQKILKAPFAQDKNTRDNVQSYVSEVAKQVGIEDIKVEFNDDLRHEGKPVAALYTDGKIQLHTKLGVGTRALEILHHEIGHAIHDYVIRKTLGVRSLSMEAMNEVHPEIVEAYDRYLEDNDQYSNDVNEDLERSPHPVTMARDSRDVFQGMNTFQEWFADNVAKALSNQLNERGVVAQFFHDIATELKRIYDYIRGNPDLNQWTADQTVEEFVRNLFDGDHAAQTTLNFDITPEQAAKPTEGNKSGSIEERFPKLVSTRLMEGMKNVGSTLSRVVGLSNPAVHLIDAIAEEESLKDLAGKDLKINDEQRRAYYDLLGNVDDVVSSIQSMIDTKVTDELWDKFKNGESENGKTPMNLWPNYRLLNLCEEVDGRPVINRELAEIAFLAAAKQLVSESRGLFNPMDSEDVQGLASSLGVPFLAADVREQLAIGTPFKFLVQDVANTFNRYAGLKANESADAGIAEGISLSMAMETLKAMASVGLFEVSQFGIDKEGNMLPHGTKGAHRSLVLYSSKDRIDRIRAFNNGERIDTSNSVTSKPDLIEQLVMKEPESTTHYYEGEKIPLTKTQLHNPSTPLTSAQTKALKFETKVPFKINTSMALLNHVIGAEGQVALYGDPDVNDRLESGTINTFHAERLKSKNAQILRSHEAAVNTYQSATERAETTGEKIHEIPHFFNYTFTKANRMQMLGNNNPQSDKINREILMSTSSTLDLSNQDMNNAHYVDFMKGIAQALGYKVHQKTAAQSVEFVKNKLGSESMQGQAKFFANLHDATQRIESGEASLNDITRKVPTSRMTELRNAMEGAGLDVTPAAIYAVHEYFRMANSTPAELSNYKTNLYFEADGVTNGVINTIIMTATEVDSNFLEAMRRGGLYVGQEEIGTLNKYMSDPSHIDTYNAVAKETAANLKTRDFGEVFEEGKNHLFNLINKFISDIEISPDGNITISRNGVKKPVTSSNYGAGDRSLANGMVNGVVAAMQEKISEAMLKDSTASLAEALFGSNKDDQRAGMRIMQYLIGNTPHVDGDEHYTVDNSEKINFNQDVQSFELSPNQFAALADWIQTLYVPSFRDGMAKAIGNSTVAAMDRLKTYTGIGSLILEQVYQYEVDQMIEAKKAANPGWSPKQGLSKNELQTINDKMRELLPFVEHDGTRVDLLGRDKSQGTTDIVEGMTKTPHVGYASQSLYTPSYIGVGGLPLYIQAAGDANMMLKASNSKNVNAPQDKTLKTFDGQQSAIQYARGLSVNVNSAVADTWNNNIYQDLVPVLTALRDGVGQYQQVLSARLADKSSQFQGQLSRLLEAKKGIAPQTNITTLVNQVLGNLELDAKSHQTFLDNLNQYKWDVDQMAGMESPYTVNRIEGKTTSMSDEELIKELGGKDQIAAPSAVGLDSLAQFTDDDRIKNLTEQMANRVTDYVQSAQGSDKAVRVDDVEAAQAFALKGAQQFVDFGLDTDQVVAATSMVAAFSTGMALDGTALQSAQKLYMHALDKLTLSDFLTKDPMAATQGEMQEANTKMEVIQGLNAFEDAYGRGSPLPIFMALAAVSPELRSILSKMDVPAKDRSGMTGIDATIENAGFDIIDRLNNLYTRENKAKNVQEALDTLQEVMWANREENNNLISVVSTVGGAINMANDTVVKGFSKLGERLGKSADLQDKSTQLGKLSSNLKRIASSLLNTERAAAMAEGISATMNKSDAPQIFRSLMTDLLGRTESNKDVYDLVKVVHADASQTRQLYTEGVPATINSKFTRELSKNEHKHVHEALAKTDIQALDGLVDREKLHTLITDDNARHALIDTLEQELDKADPSAAIYRKDKARQLAEFMMTGKTGSMLLKNAHAIAAGITTANPNFNVDPAVVKAVDQLVSLYAAGMVSNDAKLSMTNLGETEGEAFHFIVSQAIGNAKDESQFDKANKLVRWNRMKGHFVNQSTKGRTLVVANAVKGAELLGQGYEQVGEYVGSTADRSRGKLHYYALPMSANSTFGQGLIQTVRMTAGGVDQSTGFRTNNTAGVITDPTAVKRITKLLGQEKGNELVTPVFDSNGNVYAFERSLDPSMVEQHLKPEYNMPKQLGLQAGNRIEQEKSNYLNEAVVNRAFDMYKADQSRVQFDPSMYQDMFTSKDPVIQAAVKNIPPHVKDMIKRKFGDQFMVRKDVINMVVGEHAASVSDLWTGVSRYDPKTIEAMKSFAINVFGNKAYRYLNTAETIIEAGVGQAKRFITTVSIVVPWANIVSNMKAQLMRGIPIHTQIKQLGKKTLEIRSYMKSRRREIELETLLRAETRPDKVYKIRKELEQISDGNKRLSIWPLLQAGEFSAISDVEGKDSDLFNAIDNLTKGKLGEAVDGLVSKMPEEMLAAGKNFMLTPDSALGKFLDAATTYGDFLAKAIFYDSMIQKGFSKEATLGKVTEEYVNYDLPAGRWRGKLEKAGMAWFLNYPLRTVKVGLNMIRENPVHALLSQFVPFGVLSRGTGSPLEDNLMTKLATGRIKNSFGFGMGIHAHALTPLGRVLGTAM